LRKEWNDMPYLASRTTLAALILCGAAAAQQDRHTAAGKNLEYAETAPTPSKYTYQPRVKTDSPGEFTVQRVTPMPAGFMGVWSYDPASDRMFLLSFGPPANTKGASTIYELDPESGKVIAEVRMPFLGECSSAVFMDGFIYAGVPHESKIYKVMAQDKASLGKVVGSIPVPSLAELKLGPEEPFRFPFISFFGMVATPEHNLMIHAQEIGELITLDRETGKILNRAKTLRALGGMTPVPGPNGEFMLLANADPEAAALRAEMRRFMFRSNHGITPPSAVRPDMNCGRPEARDIRWVLIDGQTGDLLAATTQQCVRTNAGSVALLGYEKAPGTRYGRFRFLAGGEERMIATIEWTPSENSFF
jgi:hypothetical protein